MSRLANLSRQLNNFFTIFLPYTLKTDAKFKNIYTVFTGGDDLFLIGPWNTIIDFAQFINDEFRKYVCENNDVTLSAGITVNKPDTPIVVIAEQSEKALKKSKKGRKNRITLFGETAEWSEFRELMEIKNTFEKWLENETINNAMIFRLNEFIETRKQEQEILKGQVITIEDMECFKWRAKFKYTVVRNIGKKLKDEEKQKLIDEFMKIETCLEKFGGALKIPLWQVIYNNRK